MKAERYSPTLMFKAVNAAKKDVDDSDFLSGLGPAPELASMFPATTDLVPHHNPPPETPDEIERLKSMLSSIPADCGYDQYRQIAWSVLSTGWDCAEQQVHNWAQSAPHRFDEDNFNTIVKGFKPDGGTRFGTLIYYARQYGWTDLTPSNALEFDGKGADVKAGEFFAEMHRGSLLFIYESDETLVFDEVSGWVQSPPGEVDRRAKLTLQKLRETAAEAFKLADSDDHKSKRLIAFVERLSKASNLRAMPDMAKSEPDMTVSINEFDADIMLLGVKNGVLNLRTQELLPISSKILVSKRCNVAYDPSATCPRFSEFINEIQPDPEMVKFLQVMIAYCLTGSVSEQKLLFLYGVGANGKSVLIELIAWLLGDYARKIATEMLMQHQRNPQGPSPDIVALKGVRLAYANETEEGRRLSEARVKDLTGGDTLVGRVTYGKVDIMFQPTHKLWIIGNHKPDIRDNSYGMWRRIMLALFGVTIPEDQRDPNLLDKLKTEGPGILNWALDGVRIWQKDGLQVPDTIKAATTGYRDEQDIIGEWIHEHCDTGTNCTGSKKELYRAYQSWCIENGHRPLAQGRLTRRLNERGYSIMPDKRTVSGLSLNDNGRRDAS